MENKRKMFDRELAERPMSAALDAGSEWAMFGVKVAVAVQDQMLRSARSLTDHTASAVETGRRLTEELIGVNRKFLHEMQNVWLDTWNNAADNYKLPDLKPTGGDKKSA